MSSPKKIQEYKREEDWGEFVPQEISWIGELLIAFTFIILVIIVGLIYLLIKLI